MGDSYRDELAKKKKKDLPAASTAVAISKERQRIRAEHFRKSREGYRKTVTEKRLI